MVVPINFLSWSKGLAMQAIKDYFRPLSLLGVSWQGSMVSQETAASSVPGYLNYQRLAVATSILVALLFLSIPTIPTTPAESPQVAPSYQRVHPIEPTPLSTPDDEPPPHSVSRRKGAEHPETSKSNLKSPNACKGASSKSYELVDGDVVLIPCLQVHVGARFFERDDFTFARFWIEPEGEGVLQQPPVIGPGSIDFPTLAGVFRLDVMSLDTKRRSATVRVRFAQDTE